MKRLLLLMYVCLISSAAVFSQEKVFKGSWQSGEGDDSCILFLDLYEKTVENGFAMDADLTYGTLDVLYGNYYTILDAKIDGNVATIKMQSQSGENAPMITKKVIYHPENKSLELQMNRADGKLVANAESGSEKVMFIPKDFSEPEVQSATAEEQTEDNFEYLPKADTYEEGGTGEESGIDWVKVGMTIVIIGGLLGYTIFFIFFKRNELSEAVTSDYFTQLRLSKGMPAQSTPEENVKVEELLNQIEKEMTTLTNNKTGESFGVIMKKSQYKECVVLLKQAKELAPTDLPLVERLQAQIISVLYSQKRSFNGSYSVMAAGLIMTAIMGFMMPEVYIVCYFLAAIALYYFACYSPQYIVMNQLFNGKKSSGGLIGALGRYVGNVKPKVYVYNNHDLVDTVMGDNKTYFINRDEQHIALFMAIIAFMIVGVCIIYIAIWKFFKNFVLN